MIDTTEKEEEKEWGSDEEWPEDYGEEVEPDYS